MNEKLLGILLRCKCFLLRNEAITALKILQNTVMHFENHKITTEIVSFCQIKNESILILSNANNDNSNNNNK